ncbi:unnamed protein product, partial [Didymodactylos carnosus]
QGYNFEKKMQNEVNSLGFEYDYLSIMHYAHNTFSRDEELDTIRNLNAYDSTLDLYIGQRNRLSDECGGNVLWKPNEVMSIRSPNYLSNDDSTYPCKWRLIASLGQTIHLTIKQIRLTKEIDCGEDAVRVYDGYNSDYPSKLIGRFCNTTISPITLISTGRYLWIEYRRSSHRRAHKPSFFEATWK